MKKKHLRKFIVIGSLMLLLIGCTAYSTKAGYKEKATRNEANIKYMAYGDYDSDDSSYDDTDYDSDDSSYDDTDYDSDDSSSGEATMDVYQFIAVVILFVIIAIMVYVADKMRGVADAKGYEKENHIFGICFFCGIFGILYVMALPDLTIREQNNQIIKLLLNNDEMENDNFYDSELPEL